MFRDLAKFEKQRTAGEAVGFWLAYLVLGFLLAAVVGGCWAALQGTETFEAGVAAGAQAGMVFGVVYSLALTVVVSLKKSSGFLGIFLSGIAALLALFGGALLGLIPTAFLTTRPISEGYEG